METPAPNYSKLATLGEGTYGVVYKCKDASSNSLFALKRYRNEEEGEGEEEEGVSSSGIREVMCLRVLSHPNVIKLHSIFFQSAHLHLKMDLHQTVLSDYLKSMPPANFNRDHFKSLAYQLLLALQHCHKNYVSHRDVKPHNILLTFEKDDEAPRLILADFGLARPMAPRFRRNLAPHTLCPFEPKFSQTVCTLWYRSHDVIIGSDTYGHDLDTWSAACVIMEMFCYRRPLFPGGNDLDQIFKIWNLLGTPKQDEYPDLYAFPEQFPHIKLATIPKFAPKPWGIGHQLLECAPDETKAKRKAQDCCICGKAKAEKSLPVVHCNECFLLIDLVQLMLTLDPKKRPTASRCLAHPFFKSFRTSSK